MRILISGAGIAGPTLAWWLHRYGIRSTIVESAPELRSGGYVIDFWGAGFDIAERMGILPELLRVGYAMQEVRLVDDDGRAVGGFDVDVFRELTAGRYVSLPRSALAAALTRALPPEVELRFGDRVTALEPSDGGVRVEFAQAPAASFDAVVGADGLHSGVRELAFGPEASFERYLGYCVAAFEVEGYRPRDELVYVMYTEVGRQIARFTLAGNRTMFLFIWAETRGDADVPHGLEERRARLRERFAGARWEAPAILAAMARTDAIYFDRVSQIRLDRWSRGRVGLVGDAAYAPSFLAGQGSALAMIGAYVLAWQLAHAPDPATALERYHAYLAKFLHGKQEAALGFAGTFVPSSRLRLALRNRVSRLLRIRWIARLVAGRGLLDRITLPEASPPAASA